MPLCVDLGGCRIIKKKKCSSTSRWVTASAARPWARRGHEHRLEPVVRQRRSGFGLLHGMGFAGALAETGLPQDNLMLALLFFNVGIEIGQLAFIFLVLAIWYTVRKPLAPWGDRLLPVPVYILGAFSAMWCIERGLAALLA